MSEEKERIGEDVLGGGYPMSSMSPKKRRELEKKLKEELAKKKAEEEAKRKEEEEKLPKLPIPGEKPPEMSIEEWEALKMRARLTGELLQEEEKKTIHVRKHKRKPPKKEKFEEIF